MVYISSLINQGYCTLYSSSLGLLSRILAQLSALLSNIPMSALRGILFEMRTWARCFIPTSRYVAPFYPTPDHIVDRMLRVASVGPGDVVFDLGCGDGKVNIKCGCIVAEICISLHKLAICLNIRVCVYPGAAEPQLDIRVSIMMDY